MPIPQICPFVLWPLLFFHWRPDSDPASHIFILAAFVNQLTSIVLPKRWTRGVLFDIVITDSSEPIKISYPWQHLPA
jgi:hypothetical protein